LRKAGRQDVVFHRGERPFGKIFKERHLLRVLTLPQVDERSYHGDEENRRDQVVSHGAGPLGIAVRVFQPSVAIAG
jgi:hypothetical protein